MALATLEEALGHCFADRGLLQTALTHRSFGAGHNERLEFLGDSILNCVIAVTLYRRFPGLPEGDLSRLRANLVRQDTLQRIAQNIALGPQLRLGEGELRSGGEGRPSILADALEAMLGAVFLDAGFSAAELVVERLFAELLDGLNPGEACKDAKTRLQEWLQGRRQPLPKYATLGTTGAAHSQRFEVACELERLGVRTVGTGSSRRLAEQAAAELALRHLEP
ncbi:MAG TPA: ribonuclease III [Rhodocyclaceae bacterium]|jgi:ribonuclease-3|nr:ribonuclease III [Betaproteobacteria bacterium]HMV00776.1 ribonuclease III [Rhodocyclaceae bacterium]HMV21644.1 ribonuclease III [Rhodocyclaceae bacterium]HNE43292.1 ribonuclease III [Rhodocyclaceae bacterium]HNM22103.1 ribonuclease III [Rhodocyclaceae bacterium]